ncbi:MAG: bile acid:sodium symporter family protein [Myxococcales bacterium]|nr:bile acid:sodium symporter family protein [Myxococcales bacterium]
MASAPAAIDSVRIAFSPNGLRLLNVIIALIMFGIALDLRVDDFRRVVTRPRAVVVILVTQLVLLPALTFGLTQALPLAPSVALGMILVAACPGGNVSNLMTHLARGNTELSVTLTAIVTAGAIVFTPLNLSVWASLDPGTRALLRVVHVDPVSMFFTIFVILGLPLAVGMLLAARRPSLAARMRGPFRRASMLFLLAFIVMAATNNWSAFMRHLPEIFPIVILHNALALALGFTTAALFRLGARERRTATIEIGIQNAGLGLILIFAFFGGLGGMAYVAALWGGWHIVAGLLLAAVWSRRPPADADADEAADETATVTPAR